MTKYVFVFFRKLRTFRLSYTCNSYLYSLLPVNPLYKNQWDFVGAGGGGLEALPVLSPKLENSLWLWQHLG
jgi:hypothetical protein